MMSLIKTKNGKKFLFLSIFVLAVTTFLLTYCGGGGGGGYGGGGGTIYYSISGKVTSGGTGLAGVTMTLGGAGSTTTTTDASGNYTFANLANGSYTVTPGLTGFTFTPTSSAETVSGANIASVDFTAAAVVGATFSISGTVTSGGTGLAGVTMTLSGAGSGTTTTDASGNYTFSSLANGSYTITPGLTGFTFTPTSSPQTVSSADITGVTFTAAAVVVNVQLVACPGSGTTDATIQNFAFSPGTLTISANTIVKWTNNDSTTHTVTSTTVPANGSFDSGNITPGTSVCFKFTVAGTYQYHCSIHTFMLGTVTVQ